MRRLLLPFVAVTAVTAVASGSPPDLAGQLRWGAGTWRIDADSVRVEEHEGRSTVYLRDGTMWLEGAALRDGAIRFDMRAGGELGFHGVAFRAVDPENYEHVYLRPFVSGYPDASQYTPVFRGTSGWQIYTGPRFGLPVDVPVDRWVRVELRFRDDRAELRVDGHALLFPALQRDPASGALGLTSSGAPVRFADVVVTESPPRVPETDPDETGSEGLAPGTVTSWRISTAFAEDRLDAFEAGERIAPGLAWDTLRTDVRGIANIARIRRRTPTTNTVVAETTVAADAPRTVRLRLGFSDRVRVYLNGTPVYRGRAEWRSRDYKFLGTVGLFDEVVLPLREGDNQVWLAVSEDFGGWAVAGQILEGTTGHPGGAG